MLATDSEFSHIPFSTSLRKAAAQGEERHWAVQPTVAGGTFLEPTGPAARVRAPRIPRKRLRPGRGCQSRNRPELSTPRTRCSALHGRLGSSSWNHGPRPRRDGLGCLTSAESSRLPDSDGRHTNQGRRSGDQ
jgi:hypothetical protein